MRQLNGVYSQSFARRHRRPGHVLQGRFHAQVVSRDAYLREVCRYIVLNPVRAGLVTHPRHWPWSSYRATAGEVAVPAFLTVDWVLSLADTPVRAHAEQRYRKFVEAALGETAPLVEALSLRLVVGDSELLSHVRQRLTSSTALVEVPRAQRFALRPALATLFAGVTSKGDRNVRCALAVQEHGYTMKEIGEFLGLHYATVSRALSRYAEQPAASGVLDFKT